MKKLITAVVAVLALCSCGSEKSLYSWYDYEDTTYKYSKRQTDEWKERALKSYQKMSKKQKGTRGVVPPGLYAEYGFMLCNSGNVEEGKSYLRQEIELYPESEIFISRIIKQLEK